MVVLCFGWPAQSVRDQAGRWDTGMSGRHWGTIERDEFPQPQREAAFFFGLFLRGYPAERLRRDIEVPREMLAKWKRSWEQGNAGFPVKARRAYEFRKQVLAIFDFLVSSQNSNSHKM